MKILASDFDGTLCVEGKIDKKDIEGIKKLRKEGHKFIVSTGRTLIGMQEAIDKYSIEFDYLVLCNGALILDKDLKVIENNLVDFSDVKKIIEEFSGKEDTMIYFDNGNGMNIIKNPKVDMNKLEFFSELKVIISSKEDILNLKSGALIVGVFSPSGSVEKAEEIRNKLLHMFGDKLSIFRNQFFVDIVSKGCSKGNGLSKVLKLENKDFSDIYTVGDSFNDVSMFDITENSYTFNRAEEGIKKYAKNHIDFVHEVVDKLIKS